jgi:fatty acid synthase subunit alpha, fungi type
LDLFARFLSFVASSLHDDVQSTSARTSLLANVFAHFTATYLTNKDVHSVAASCDTDVRKTVLSSYFLALAALEDGGVKDIPRGPASALLSAAAKGDASIFALFGGQGSNEVYFDELQSLYDIYKPYVAPFLSTITDEILKTLPLTHEATSFYTHGLDVMSWLTGTKPRPSTAYFVSIPVSLPLIGLTQLVQYLVVARASGLTPGQLRDRISGATGHSQGVVSAVAIAASTTLESFTENAKKAIRWLFFCGLRGQEAFPVLSLEPSIIDDAVEGGEGVPSPMLAVTGLALKDLEPHIKRTNGHLPANSKLHVSLHNGPRAFVITGPARALYGLVTNLRKVRAPTGLDQSKTPFSQRKLVFSVRFLTVNAPYHSEYLASGIDKLCEDLGGEELWTAKELGIPVYNTEDGRSFLHIRDPLANLLLGTDMRKLTTSVTRSLCVQIFTSPIHWFLATNFPEIATHAIDFGPGGMSGIGSLSARNFDGRGIRVVVVGDKGKGDAELYDSQKVRYEEWWSKKWGPKLVRTRYATCFLNWSYVLMSG